MVMRPGPLFDAVESLSPTPETRVALLTPQGQTFTQAKAQELAACPHLVLLCAGTMRASMSESGSILPPRKSQSAIMCSPAASCPL